MHAFYALAKSMSTEQISKTIANRTVSAQNTKATGWAENGVYLPIGAWAAKGFDRTVIEEKARACLPACLLACLPACLLACLPACQPACMPA